MAFYSDVVKKNEPLLKVISLMFNTVSVAKRAFQGGLKNRRILGQTI